MRAFLTKCVFVLVAATVACDASSPDFVVGPPPSQSIQASAISLSTNGPSLTVGQSLQLSAVVLDASGNVIPNPAVSWSSSDTRVASVSVTGLLAALSLGTATVTATSGGVSKTATVAVAAGTTPPPPNQGNGNVALPTLMDTPMPTAPSAGGKVISVAANGDLQAAINAALPGDVIELARGATYTGQFTLPDKGASTSWIVIRPAAGTSLPSEGQRMTPALAASLTLPKIVTPDYQAAIATKLGAHHYRLVGLEITVAPAQTFNYGLVLLGSGDVDQTTVASIAHDVVLDRVYIHGTEAASLKRCVGLNSAATAIIDSYLSECHGEGQDAQAIGGWNGPGPYKIVNNTLEGAAENILLGGDDPKVPGLVPSDIEIRGNYIAKPVSWHGSRWLVKNLLELKNARRVLIEGNVLEHNWANGQEGAAVVLKSVNQGGTCPWCVTQDITFRRNIVRYVGAGIVLAANPDNTNPTTPASRISVVDNLVYGINQPGFEGNGRGFQIGGGTSSLVDVTITHNTVIGSTNTAITFTGPPSTRLSVTDNVLEGGAYGIIGDNTGVGTLSLAAFAPGASFVRNVLVIKAEYSSQFPTGNSYPATLSAVGFQSIAGADFHLASNSPFKSAPGTSDPGADIDAVQTAVAGVVLP